MESIPFEVIEAAMAHVRDRQATLAPGFQSRHLNVTLLDSDLGVYKVHYLGGLSSRPVGKSALFSSQGHMLIENV